MPGSLVDKTANRYLTPIQKFYDPTKHQYLPAYNLLDLNNTNLLPPLLRAADNLFKASFYRTSMLNVSSIFYHKV